MVEENTIVQYENVAKIVVTQNATIYTLLESSKISERSNNKNLCQKLKYVTSNHIKGKMTSHARGARTLF